MSLILITQLFTNKSIFALKKSNLQAVETFKINNRLQKIANFSFDLQSKLGNPNLVADEFRRIRLTDSLTMLGYNASILINELGENNFTKNIDWYVTDQLGLSFQILANHQYGKLAKQAVYADSLRSSNPGEKIYSNCLEIQKSLENSLQQVLTTNSNLAGKLSGYNRILAVFAILAVVILATLVIRKQSQQLVLIENLKNAESAALKSKNAKEEFLANMSHELRTPLNALIGFGNLLSETNLDEKQKEYLKIIQSGSNNLLNIVNDVLDLSKIEAGKLEFKKEPFNLEALFKNLELLFSDAISQKSLYYQWYIDHNIPKVLKGDADRLQQVLINLISNGIKFTNTGGLKINTALVWSENSTNEVKIGITVKDTGVGIPSEKIQSVFERFEQLENVTTRQHGGTGLGLTIVKNLVEKMGGSMSVYSEEGKGSEFSFTCIFEKCSEKEVEKDDYVVAEAPELHSYSILIVEDNKANQLFLKYLLEKYKPAVFFADDGLQAIELLKNNKYDLILMDIQMPKLDGFDTLSKIKKDFKAVPPVIAMTAYVSEQDIKKCREAGFDDYIAKPIDESALIEKILSFLPSVYNNSNNNDSLTYLKTLVGDDDVVIKEILTEMKTQWKLDVQDLWAAVEAGNQEGAKRVLHRIKSTFSPLGSDSTVYQFIIKETSLLNKENIISLDSCKRFIQGIRETTSDIF
ncbi:MAG TPA: response regulator [Niabella sp.]|nr:response regulator [Chitinophagaceae bacterium]HRO84331.1 response regulator [Niabella sp.]HUN01742.1 response regulator [Niabella sp.]